MKHIAISIALFALHSALCTRAAAVPEEWDVDLSAQPPQVFTLQRPRGETYELEVVLKNHGKPFAPAITNACIYWQTNGMENLYWSAPASVSNNVLKAYWLPEMDPGASTVRGFIGDPGHIYAAAFTFRFLSSPGATPNALPLPQPVIDFAKVRVLNPPWGGGGGEVATNAVVDIIRKTVDGSAKTLPKYLWLYEADDSYPAEAEEYYRSRGNGQTDGGCSAVRSGGFLSRNFDFPFDDRAEFVVKMAAGAGRFASVGVAQVGTNLTERIVTSGKPSRCYKWLPGATVDGINENGVVCEINVVDTDPPRLLGGDIHPLAAVRWALDNGTSAEMVATNLASRIMWPSGWAQNFHWMIADERETWIVENGTASNVTAVAAKRVMTNFPILPDDYEGMGKERYDLLRGVASITNAWYTNAYRRETNPPWVSDLAEVIAYTNEIFDAWAAHPKEHFRSTTTTSDYNYTWWQSVHTSIYDITNRTLRIAVQETDDWYVFAVPSAGGVKPEAVREIVAPMLDAKLDGPTVAPSTGESASGKAADAKATGDRFDALRFLGYTSDGYRYKVFLSHDEDPEYSTLSFGDLFPFYDFGTGQIWCGDVFSARGHGFYTYSPERSNRIAMNYDGFTAPNGWDAGDTAYFTAGKLNGDNAPNTGDWNQFRRLTRVTGDTMIYEGLGDVLDNFATKDDTYTKTETDALIAANKPEYEDIPSNVVWRIEAEGGRFFIKPVRPINVED